MKTKTNEEHFVNRRQATREKENEKYEIQLTLMFAARIRRHLERYKLLNKLPCTGHVVYSYENARTERARSRIAVQLLSGGGGGDE